MLVLAQGDSLLGKRHFWPVWQAAEKHKLPVAIHAGSAYRGAPSSIGWPSYRYEYYLAEAQAFQAQILSLVYEGVFGKFPGLKVVLMESGVSWLPAFMWRANKTWRGVRVEVPWVEREPASIIRDHIRVTMQPFDGPPDAAGVADVSSRSAPTRCSCSRPTIRTGSSTATIRCRRICLPVSSRACAPTIRLKPFRG